MLNIPPLKKKLLGAAVFAEKGGGFEIKDCGSSILAATVKNDSILQLKRIGLSWCMWFT